MELDRAALAEGVEAARADIAAGRLMYRWGGHAGHWATGLSAHSTGSQAVGVPRIVSNQSALGTDGAESQRYVELVVVFAPGNVLPS